MTRSVLILIVSVTLGLAALAVAGWIAVSFLAREDLAAAAEREGVIEIWSTTDSDRVQDLLADFRRLHPGIRVIYTDLPGSELQTDFLRAAQAGNGTADLLWSSAMDLQIKLVNDGYAATYVSPEARHLPDWAKWKDQAWGVTAEPIVIVYNKNLISPEDVPNSHVALRRFLESDTDTGRRVVATYDPVRSAVGYLYLSQDAQASTEIWRLVQAMGRDRLELYESAEDILREVSAGRAAIGYNIVASYALDEMSKQDDLGVIMPQDYTLVMSRIAMIPNDARHPAAARLFLDFLLSRNGQQRLAQHHMPPARSDVAPPPLLIQSVPLRAIRVGPGLLVFGDRLTRAHFLSLWETATSGSRGLHGERPARTELVPSRSTD